LDERLRGGWQAGPPERDGLLSLTTLLFADEIREAASIPAVPAGRTGTPGRDEVAQAIKIIDTMIRRFDPNRCEDYTAAV
jgi:DNA end-binding protein Ku